MKICELTKFAIMLFLLPWIPAFLLYRHSEKISAFIILALFLCLSLISFFSITFAKNFKFVLEKIGKMLGKYISIFILVIGYIIAVLPTGLLMKIVHRDRLKLKKTDVKSYWIDSEETTTDYEYQF